MLKMEEEDMKKTIVFGCLFLIIFNLMVFADDNIEILSTPAETLNVANSDTLRFAGTNGDLIPYNYAVKVSYDGKVDININNNIMTKTIYSHHIYALGNTLNGDPSVNLLQIVIKENETEKARITSFARCYRDHLFPGGQKIYFDSSSTTRTTIGKVRGSLMVVVQIYEYDVWFINPLGSIDVSF